MSVENTNKETAAGAECPLHGAMVTRPTAKQSPEQRWCGGWWDCEQAWERTPGCGVSYLLPSTALLAQTEQLAAEASR